MSFMQIQEGSTGIILPVYLQDSSGVGLGGVAYTDVSAFYKRQGASAVAITEAAGTEGTWSSGGWVAAAGLAPGNYELHIPDAAFAAGAGWVLIEVGVTGARTERFLIELGPFEVTLPANMDILAIDANGVVNANTVLIEGVDATDQITANSSGSTPAAIADAVWDEPRAGHVAAGSFGQGVASVQGDVTGNVGGNVIGTVADVVATVDANVLTIEGLDATDQIAANSSGGATAAQISAQVWTDKESVDVGSIAGSTAAATNLARSAEKLIVGNALTVSATAMTANIAVAGNLIGATIVWDNGARATITSYSLNAGVGTFGYAPLDVVPGGTAAFAIY